MRIQRKKWMLVMIVMTLSVYLFACGRSGEKGQTEQMTEDRSTEKENLQQEDWLNANLDNRLIFCITPATNNPYFAAVQQVCQEEGEEKGYTVTCVSHDDSAKRQTELFNRAISEGASFIICDNADAANTVEDVRTAKNAGIPVILVDRSMDQQGEAVAQILADSAQAAMQVAEELVEIRGGEGSYVELLGLETDLNTRTRSQAFHKVLDQTDMTMAAQEYADWDQETARKKIEQILQKHPEITAIVCGNDTMACGAADAVKEAGLEQHVDIIGIDGSNEMRDRIQDGEATCTSLQQIDKIVRMAVKQGDDYLNKGSTGKDEVQTISCVLIEQRNAGNLNDYVYNEN